ncbi:MAG: DUF1566 domain-containing protein [Calditrichaeota bacterium]|nr:DUF1566 domain-containing protein [Calditrichota bacterium]
MAFANDYGEDYLYKLTQEEKNLAKALRQGDRDGLWKAKIDSHTDVDSLFEIFDDYQERIAVFHFGGHAEDLGILLRNANGEREFANAVGLLPFLARHKGLKLVFINGCCTHQQAVELHKLGIPVVIGTSEPVDDAMATEISTQFYTGLASGRSLLEAWEGAKEKVATKQGENSFTGPLEKRASGKRDRKVIREFPWKAYGLDENSKMQAWRLTEASREMAETADKRQYLAKLASDCLNLPLSAMSDEFGGDELVTLDKVYIDLDTTATVMVDEDGNPVKEPQTMADREKMKTRPVKAIEAAAKNPRLVLKGDPGSGKSTFVKNLCALLARGTFPDGFPEDILPIFIQLRDLLSKLAKVAVNELPATQAQAKLAMVVQDQIVEELDRLECRNFSESLLASFREGDCLLVLDGLDEVPFGQRDIVSQTVRSALTKYHLKRVIITCRTRSYGEANQIEGFTDVTLAPFDHEKISHFIQAWYSAQSGEKLGLHKRNKKIEDLNRAAVSGELQDIARNPMLLTTMAIIHQRDVGLPDKRVELYDLAVDVLVRRWRKHKVGESLSTSGKLNEFLKDDHLLRPALERLAFEAHCQKPEKTETGDLERFRALEILEEGHFEGNLTLANEFLDYVDQQSGLLLGNGAQGKKPTTYRFPHRTFQEYLTGCYLMSHRDREREVLRLAGKGDYWSVAMQLGFEEMLFNRRSKNELLNLAYFLCGREEAANQAEERSHLWSANIAVLLGESAIKSDRVPNGGETYLNRLRQSLIARLSGALSFDERAEAGRNLVRLGELDKLKIPPLYRYEIKGREFEEEFAKARLTELDLFISDWHPQGNGCIHVYEPLHLEGKNLIFDHATGLIWQQSGSERLNYADAQKYIDQLNQQKFAGFDDWRLPTLEEAMSLMEREEKNEGLYINPLFDLQQFYIWTADRYSASRAWLVGFNYGYCAHDRVDDFIGSYVRAVRSGRQSSR